MSRKEKLAEEVMPEIGVRLLTQDNRITADPMFCVQMLVCDSGYDARYMDGSEYCWWNPEQLEVAYQEDQPEGGGWEGPFGYKTRWQTVMVAFTEEGCKQYLELDGHNVRRQAHEGKVRIYAASFHRCPEMQQIREHLMNLGRKEI